MGGSAKCVQKWLPVGTQAYEILWNNAK